MAKRSTAVVTLNLRLPRDLHKMLVDDAASCSPPVSLNTEIVTRLYESCQPRQSSFAAVPGRTLEDKYENAARAWMQTVSELQEQLAGVQDRLAKVEKTTEGKE